jgi:hypothetical protein
MSRVDLISGIKVVQGQVSFTAQGQGLIEGLTVFLAPVTFLEPEGHLMDGTFHAQ